MNNSIYLLLNYLEENIRDNEQFYLSAVELYRREDLEKMNNSIYLLLNYIEENIRDNEQFYLSAVEQYRKEH